MEIAGEMQIDIDCRLHGGLATARAAAQPAVDNVAVGGVVHHRRQQVVSRFDGMEIAGEMQIDVLHGHDLGITAAGGAAFHAEGGHQSPFHR